MKNNNSKDETLLIEMLIRKFLSLNVDLNLGIREIWLLSCALSFLKNRNVYSNKESISISYESNIAGKTFNFRIWFSSTEVTINSLDYYSDIEGVYNKSSYVRTLNDSNQVFYDKRDDDKREADIKRLEYVLEDVDYLILKKITPKIESEILELKMKSSSKHQIQLDKLEKSLEFYNNYGPKLEVLKLEKKIEELKKKMKN